MTEFTTLQALSDDMAAAVEAVDAGIVRVAGRKRIPATGIAWTDSVIVTAHHVLTRDENISIGLADGSTLTATLAGRDPTTDLAALRVDSGDLTAPAWVDPDDLKVGQIALALGRPGRAVQATLGVIHTLAGDWRTPAGGRIARFVQSDVTMYPGFSGGPLLDASGAVIGLNTSALLRGHSISLPQPTVARVVEMLLAHGHVQRGYLGIGSQPVRLPEKLASELDQDAGLLIVTVEPDSPADEAGLVLGDTLVGLDDQPVRHADDLSILLTGDRVGQTVAARIVRGGQVQIVEVVIGMRPSGN